MQAVRKRQRAGARSRKAGLAPARNGSECAERLGLRQSSGALETGVALARAEHISGRQPARGEKAQDYKPTCDQCGLHPVEFSKNSLICRAIYRCDLAITPRLKKHWLQSGRGLPLVSGASQISARPKA